MRGYIDTALTPISRLVEGKSSILEGFISGIGITSLLGAGFLLRLVQSIPLKKGWFLSVFKSFYPKYKKIIIFLDLWEN